MPANRPTLSFRNAAMLLKRRPLLRIFLLTAALFSLSGCVINSQKETLEAIQQLDASLQQRLETLEQHNQAQSEQLTRLQKQLRQNDKALTDLKASHARLLTLVEKKQKTAPAQTLSSDNPHSRGKVVLGSKEWVWLDAAQDNFKARVDSGAATSSMHATDPVLFERNGDQWVRFRLEIGDEADEKDDQRIIEAPIVRWVRILQASSEKPERRPVIEAWIQVGGLREKAEFTLANRENMTFPILLGREFFKDVALIDVGKAYIHPKQQPASSDTDD